MMSGARPAARVNSASRQAALRAAFVQDVQRRPLGRVRPDILAPARDIARRDQASRRSPEGTCSADAGRASCGATRRADRRKRSDSDGAYFRAARERCPRRTRCTSLSGSSEASRPKPIGDMNDAALEEEIVDALRVLERLAQGVARPRSSCRRHRRNEVEIEQHHRTLKLFGRCQAALVAIVVAPAPPRTLSTKTSFPVRAPRRSRSPVRMPLQVGHYEAADEGLKIIFQHAGIFQFAIQHDVVAPRR